MARRIINVEDVLFARREALLAKQRKGSPAATNKAAFSRRELLAGAGIAACGLAVGCAGQENVHVPNASDMVGGPQVAAALHVTNPATNREIEGYASAPSINRGESISLYVNTSEPMYTLEVFRIGWYGGQGSRSMITPLVLPGTKQPDPPIQATGLIECDWQDPYVLQTSNSLDPSDWPSGVYVAKLTASASGKESYIIFVVRDDTRASDLLFQTSVNTYQAYNDWGGRSLYTSPRAYAVSFNRPYNDAAYGTGDFLCWEFHMVRFLESQGYDVTYTTDVDTHVQGGLLRLHKAFLVVGHDEYWTWAMRDNVEDARNGGVNLGFFGSNVSYWQIRYEPSPITKADHRTIVCFKEQDPDPMAHASSSLERRYTTVRYRSHMVGRPEDILVGQMWETWPAEGDIVITDASHWIFEQTGLKNGDHLTGLLGYEVDRMWSHSPAGTYRITYSTYKYYGETRHSDMTVYTARSGATVIATGTMQWNWGLSNVLIGRINYENSAAQQATRNILRKFGALPNSPVAAAAQ